MRPAKNACGGQVIVEREFATEEEAQAWMDRLALLVAAPDTNIEKHLWVTV